MRTAGIIGGISPESTVDYYRSIIESYWRRNPDGSYPRIIINSIDLATMVGLLHAPEPAGLIEFLAREVGVLARAGADFALMAANTPHIVFEDVQARSPIPMISIVEATCEAARSLGVQRVGLLGTRFTMEGGFYQDVFARKGMTLVVPAEEEQAYIHEKYTGELVNGVFLPETREKLAAIARRLEREERVQALILGGTELPLILRDMKIDGLPILDSTRIHVEAAVDALLAGP
ncbi:MAG: aspartate/glutamate racemase family protein [Acidobacteriota bacterium]